MPEAPHPTLPYALGTPEQASWLAALRAGRSAVFTGPGGTGKTTVAMRYVGLTATEHPDVLFHRLSLQENDDWANVRAFTMDAVHQAHAEVRRRAAAALKTVLLLDEYTFLDPVDYPILGLYDQVVATGDPAQGSCRGHDHPERFLDHMRAIGAEMIFTDRVWRSTNLAVSCLIDYYFYGKQTIATPGHAIRLPDIHRSNSVRGGSAGAALAIFARMLQARRMNPGFEYGIAIRDRVAIDILKKLTMTLDYADKVEIRHVYVDPAYLQGLQTNIILVNCRDMDRIYRTPQSIVRAVCTLFGRPRNRIELLFDHDAERERGGRLTFSLLVKSILAITPEQRCEMPEFEEARRELDKAGIATIPIDNGVMLYAKGSGTPLRLIHSTAAIADSGLEILNTAATADRLQWRDTIVTLPSLASRAATSNWSVKTAKSG